MLKLNDLQRVKGKKMIIIVTYFHLILRNLSFLKVKKDLAKQKYARDCISRMHDLKYLPNIEILRLTFNAKGAVAKLGELYLRVIGLIEMMRMHNCVIKTSGIQISSAARLTTKNGKQNVDLEQKTKMRILVKI